MKLVPFPSSPAFVETMTVSVMLAQQANGFQLEHHIEGPGVEALLLAEPTSTPTRRDELWKHTCVEAFFGVQGSTRYYEFNGSPSGDWALYRFDDYRQGMAPQDVVQAPVLRSRDQQRDTLRLVWRVPFFSEDLIDRAGITAVLHSRQGPGTPSYWALTHAGTKPDFHLGASFTCRLPLRA